MQDEARPVTRDARAPIDTPSEAFGEFADTSQIIADAFHHGVALGDTEGDGDLDALAG